MAIESPLKLDTTFNPVLLYNFDGNLNDSGSLGHNLVVQNGTERYSLGHEHGTKGLFFDNNLGLEGTGAPTPAPAGARITGDITIQVVMRWSTFGIGSFGSELVGCKGTTASEPENILYTITLANDANRLGPQFQWEYGAGSTRVTIENTDFSMVQNRWYHIVARRSDAGGGNSLGEIFVNNTLVASGTDVSASGGTNAYMRVGRNNSGNVALEDSVISSIKIVPFALTNDEIAQEYLRIKEAIK